MNSVGLILKLKKLINYYGAKKLTKKSLVRMSRNSEEKRCQLKRLKKGVTLILFTKRDLPLHQNTEGQRVSNFNKVLTNNFWLVRNFLRRRRGKLLVLYDCGIKFWNCASVKEIVTVEYTNVPEFLLHRFFLFFNSSINADNYTISVHNKATMLLSVKYWL